MWKRFTFISVAVNGGIFLRHSRDTLFSSTWRKDGVGDTKRSTEKYSMLVNRRIVWGSVLNKKFMLLCNSIAACHLFMCSGVLVWTKAWTLQLISFACRKFRFIFQLHPQGGGHCDIILVAGNPTFFPHQLNPNKQKFWPHWLFGLC